MGCSHPEGIGSRSQQGRVTSSKVKGQPEESVPKCHHVPRATPCTSPTGFSSVLKTVQVLASQKEKIDFTRMPWHTKNIHQRTSMRGPPHAVGFLAGWWSHSKPSPPPEDTACTILTWKEKAFDKVTWKSSSQPACTALACPLGSGASP